MSEILRENQPQKPENLKKVVKEVAPSSSVNMERLKDGSLELCRLFVVTNKFLNN